MKNRYVCAYILCDIITLLVISYTTNTFDLNEVGHNEVLMPIFLLRTSLNVGYSSYVLAISCVLIICVGQSMFTFRVSSINHN